MSRIMGIVRGRSAVRIHPHEAAVFHTADGYYIVQQEEPNETPFITFIPRDTLIKEWREK